MKAYDNLVTIEEEQKNYNEFKDDLVKYRDYRAKVVESVKSNDYDTAVNIYNSEVSPLRISMLEKLDKCI